MAIITSASKKKKTAPKNGLLPFLEIAPYKRLDGQLVVDKNDEYQSFLRIQTQNVFGMTEEEQVQLLESLTTLCRVYIDSMSLLSMKFPPSIEAPLVFWQNKLLQARERRSAIQIKIAQDNIVKLYWVEKNLPDLEFYLIIYGKTKEECQANVKLAKRFSDYILMDDLSAENVEKIIFKLCNMNTDI